MMRQTTNVNRWATAILVAALFTPVDFVCAQDSDLASGAIPEAATFVQQYCVSCHGSTDATAGLKLETLEQRIRHDNIDAWENVVRKLRSRQMPPPDVPRPDQAAYEAVLKSLEGALDQHADRQPQPGRTDTLRRLTRTEYQNAIRDLLDLEIDADTMLPADESSHGFDNVTVGELSPTLLNRYVAAAQKIARLTVGSSSRSAAGDTFRVAPDVTQEHHVAGLPLGTRGGTLIDYPFPQDGTYEIQVRLARDRNEAVEGLRGSHEMVILLDRKQVAQFTVKPPGDAKDHSQVDAHLIAKIPVTAGPHQLGVTFVKKSASLIETERQPYQARFNMHRHPRTSPAVYQVSVIGPFDATGAGDSPSRRRLFVSQPANSDDDDRCANEILSVLIRRAYRRPVADDDLLRPMEFFHQNHAEGGFDAGIEAALASVLVNPNFLFRIERDPADGAPGMAYRISDLELASRLAFFLWSSIPDDELLAVAERDELHRPDVLDHQVSRMLVDARSQSLVNNFADQWLYLRNLDSAFPDMRLFPDFDDNLRQAMRTETELFFDSVVREDRSVLDLLKSNHTFLNERLARHYGIPHVLGSRFRKVELDPATHRGGLLRHASILTVTSYATRTSPVIRGHWILKNLLGTPPPPPPDNIPALTDNTVSNSLPMRERLAQHRADASCASCHRLMDPIGFSLENYDAIGRWRQLDAGQPVDATGGLPDGSEFLGVTGLEDGILQRPELFVSTLTEKLLTYSLGRGVENTDATAIRKIVRQAGADEFRFSALVRGIVQSVPFQMRTAE